MSSACGYQCKALPGVEVASWPSCAPSYADLNNASDRFNVKPCRLSKPCRRERKLRLTNGPQRLSYRSTFQDHVLEHGPRAGSALRDHAARAKRHLWVSLRVVWIGRSLDSWTLPTVKLHESRDGNSDDVVTMAMSQSQSGSRSLRWALA